MALWVEAQTCSQMASGCRMSPPSALASQPFRPHLKTRDNKSAPLIGQHVDEQWALLAHLLLSPVSILHLEWNNTRTFSWNFFSPWKLKSSPGSLASWQFLGSLDTLFLALYAHS